MSPADGLTRSGSFGGAVSGENIATEANAVAATYGREVDFEGALAILAKGAEQGSVKFSDAAPLLTGSVRQIRPGGRPLDEVPEEARGGEDYKGIDWTEVGKPGLM